MGLAISRDCHHLNPKCIGEAAALCFNDLELIASDMTPLVEASLQVSYVHARRPQLISILHFFLCQRVCCIVGRRMELTEVTLNTYKPLGRTPEIFLKTHLNMSVRSNTALKVLSLPASYQIWPYFCPKWQRKLHGSARLSLIRSYLSFV